MDSSNADKVRAGWAYEGPTIYWANILTTAACLFDYFFSGRTWEIETLSLFVFAINGLALWNRHQELKKAYEFDREAAQQKAMFEADGEERLRRKGLI